MEKFVKWAVACVSMFGCYFSPIKPLIICVLVFIMIDFITGVVASYKRAKRRCLPWAFESSKAWRTVVKTVFVMGGLVMTWMLDKDVLDFANLNLTKIFTGFVCGVELWSYLENAAEISDHPIFRALKKFMKPKVDAAIGVTENKITDGRD